jgi:endonuclease YncB( thermonuclease family)
VVWLCGLCLVCLPLCVVAAQFSGLVVSVSDGDTLSVLREQRPAKIRLYGVDAPEKQQALGLMRSNSPPA